MKKKTDGPKRAKMMTQGKILSAAALLTMGLILSTTAFAAPADTPPTTSPTPSVNDTPPTPSVNDKTLGVPPSVTSNTTVPTQVSTAPTPSQKFGLPDDNEAFTIVPAYPNAQNRNKFIYQMRPGSETSDYAAIQNYANKEQTFLLYAANTTVSNQGTIAYKTRADMGDGPADWISFAEPAVTLRGQQAKLVKFTIRVPENTPMGDYKAGIAMEKTKQDINNPGITIASRIILHLEIKVTDTPGVITKSTEPAYQAQTLPGWKTYYFWISLTLFIISASLLVWSYLNDRKKRINSAKSGTSSEKRRKVPAPSAKAKGLRGSAGVQRGAKHKVAPKRPRKPETK